LYRLLNQWLLAFVSQILAKRCVPSASDNGA